MKVIISLEGLSRNLDLEQKKEATYGIIVEMPREKFWRLRRIIDQYHEDQDYLDSLQRKAVND